MLVHPQQNAVVVAHLIGGKGVAAGRAQGEDVALGTLKKVFLQGHQGQRGQKSLFLTEGTGLYVHILTEQQLLHLRALPFQVLHIGGGDGDQ